MKLISSLAIATASAISSGVKQVTNIVDSARSLVVEKTLLTGEINEAVVYYIQEKYKASPFNDKLYKSKKSYVVPLKKIQAVAFRGLATSNTLYFINGYPVLIYGLSNYEETISARALANEAGCALLTIRGTVDVEKLLIEAIDCYNKIKFTNDTKFQIFKVVGANKRSISLNDGPSNSRSARNYDWSGEEVEPATKNGAHIYLKWKAEEIGMRKEEDPLAGLAFPANVDIIKNEFLSWLKSEEWYKTKVIPWRRGFLLHGKPGTGKTSLIRAIAQLGDVPIYSYDLSSLSNDEMINHWGEMTKPCIALFEDIDTVFEGRKNIAGGMMNELTFDCLLNCFGGIETCDGVFIVVTTNDLSKIDPALGTIEADKDMSTRPGRLDRIFEMPALNKTCLLKIANRILPDSPALAKKLVKDNPDCSGAQFTELCVQKALENYWAKK